MALKTLLKTAPLKTLLTKSIRALCSCVGLWEQAAARLQLAWAAHRASTNLQAWFVSSLASCETGVPGAACALSRADHLDALPGTERKEVKYCADARVLLEGKRMRALLRAVLRQAPHHVSHVSRQCTAEGHGATVEESAVATDSQVKDEELRAVQDVLGAHALELAQLHAFYASVTEGAAGLRDDNPFEPARQLRSCWHLLGMHE